MTHKLENNYTTEVLPQEWKFWAPCQASQPESLATGGRRAPRECGFEGQWGLITELSWGNRNATLRGHTQDFMCTRNQRKKQWPHKSLGQTYLLVLEGFLQSWKVDCCGHGDIGSGDPGKCSLGYALFEATIFSSRPGPAQQPVGSSAVTPQAKQLIGWEHSPIHQQTGCLKSSWINSCPINTLPDTALPTRETRPSPTRLWEITSLSRHAACTSLWDTLTHHRAQSSSRKNYNPAASETETTVTQRQTKRYSKGICPR